eukprot:6407167-Amphidinium_carterae.1
METFAYFGPIWGACGGHSSSFTSGVLGCSQHKEEKRSQSGSKGAEEELHSEEGVKIGSWAQSYQ